MIAASELNERVPDKQLLTGIKVMVLPNPSTTDFTLQFKDNNPARQIAINVTDISGRTVYQTKGSSNTTYRFGNNFISGVYVVQIFDGHYFQTIKLIKN